MRRNSIQQDFYPLLTRNALAVHLLSDLRHFQTDFLKSIDEVRLTYAVVTIKQYLHKVYKYLMGSDPITEIFHR